MTFKRGSTFTATVTYSPTSGDPTDLSATTVTSYVEDANGVEYEGTVTKAGDNMSFTVTIADTVTEAWPLGPLLWDVKYITAGNVTISDTVTLNVVKNITP